MNQPKQLDLRQIEAFVAVVQSGSFTQAAERLNLAQPSLSARIQQLEQSLNGQLFQRQTRPVQLTPVGQTLLPYAERILGILEAGWEAIRVAQQGFAGRLSVGSPVSVATSLMPLVVDRFSRRYPQAELFIETSHSSNLVQQLQDGVLDLVFTATFPQLIRQVDILLRIEDRMIAGVADDHPLEQIEELTINDLWEYRVVLPRWGNAFEAHISSVRELSPSVRPMVRAPLAVAQNMFDYGDTVVFVPERFAQATGMNILNVVDLNFPWDVVLITRPGRSLSPLEEGFVAAVQESL
ncbi:MAG: LysR family transcriptional regulator [Ardenticatenaceae bacterium]|nr:LysR family transcriptional regulator [Ardenticatenaceae bacterium]